MKTSALPVPGIVLGSYPERRSHAGGRHARGGTASQSRDWPGSGSRRYLAFAERTRTAVHRQPGDAVASLMQKLHALRARFSRDGLNDASIAEAFALIGTVCTSELGKTPHDCQFAAARVILDNRLAEMATGEGKTLAAAIAAATGALAGVPVHVVTANDYLADRDARALAPLYRALHLTVGTVLQSTPREARKAVYDCDIVYATAKELVFDYLRDGLSGGRTRNELQRRASSIGRDAGNGRDTLLRGLCMAIVDEADSILIDEARVPLVISERTANVQQSRFHEQALEIGGGLDAGVDYTLERTTMTATLTPAGQSRLADLTASSEAAWRNRMHREETVCTALAALHLYERDRHYLVRDGAICIIDETTGRASPGRAWSRGLHQLIERKEGCTPSDDTQTAAQITYQRFFQRYLSLGGMSGTLRESRAELAAVYGLRIVAIAPHRPCRRVMHPARLFADRASQRLAVVEEARRISGEGRPVLIGTDSVSESRVLSSSLAAAGVAHRVLNATQNREEAAIVATAGQRGQVTVATNMAGRGTDIVLGEGVARLGGLHVICCHHNPSARADRQLIGRCARQGDPGSAQSLLSFDSPLLTGNPLRGLARLAGIAGMQRPAWLVSWLVRVPQWFEERRQQVQRRALLRRDLLAETKLSFGKAHE